MPQSAVPGAALHRFPVAALALLALLVAALSPLASAQADPRLAEDAEYSATRTMSLGGEVLMSGQLHHSHGKERWEATAMGMPMVLILRPDQQATFMLMPAMGQAMKTDLQPDVADALKGGESGADLVELVGSEAWNGETVEVYRVKENGARIWLTEDGIVVRGEFDDPQHGKGVMELSGLSRGAQDGGLFEVPSNYTVMELPQGMGGAMPGGMPGGMPGMGATGQ